MSIKTNSVDNSDKIIRMMDGKLRALMEEVGQDGEGNVADAAPVGTELSTGIENYHGSTLKNSITHMTGENDYVYFATIGTDVFYAPYVEFGTGSEADNNQGRKGGWNWQDENGDWHYTEGMAPRHFMKDGINETLRKFRFMAIRKVGK